MIRFNWYKRHPAYCTCYSCNEGYVEKDQSQQTIIKSAPKTSPRPKYLNPSQPRTKQPQNFKATKCLSKPNCTCPECLSSRSRVNKSRRVKVAWWILGYTGIIVILTVIVQILQYRSV